MATKYYKLTKRGKDVFAYGVRKGLWEGKIIVAIALRDSKGGATKDDIYNKYRGMWWGSPRNALTRPLLTKLLNKLKRDDLIK